MVMFNSYVKLPEGKTIVIVMLFDMIIDMIVDDYWYSLTIDDQKVIAVGIFCVNSQCQLPPCLLIKHCLNPPFLLLKTV